MLGDRGGVEAATQRAESPPTCTRAPLISLNRQVEPPQKREAVSLRPRRGASPSRAPSSVHLGQPRRAGTCLRQIEKARATRACAEGTYGPAAADAARALPGGAHWRRRGEQLWWGGPAAGLGFPLPSRPRERRERGPNGKKCY